MSEIINAGTRKVPIDSVTPHPDNPRQGDLGAIIQSVEAHGFYGSLVVQKSTGHILAGNHRWMAARHAGLKEVPVTFVDVDDEKARRILVADNRTSDLGTYDDSVLAGILKDLAATEIGLDGTGYDGDDLDTLLSDLGELGHPFGAVPARVDEKDALREKWGVEDGQVWQAGEHRIVCGDSTDPATLIIATSGDPASVVFTSPPYFDLREYGQPVTDWTALMRGCFAALESVTGDESQVFVNIGLVHRENQWVAYWQEWLDALDGWRRFGWYVWDQGSGMPGDWNGRLAPSFEFIFHLNRAKRKPRKTDRSAHAGAPTSSRTFRKADGDTKPTHGSNPVGDYKIPDSVIRVGREAHSQDTSAAHPARFPVELPGKFIDAYTSRGDVVLDPFLGSGTTIAACESAGRRGVGVELDAGYVSVTLERLAEMGLTPERVQ